MASYMTTLGQLWDTDMIFADQSESVSPQIGWVYGPTSRR